MSRRVRSFVFAALVAAWFLAQTWPGIFKSFTEDDLMNMYAAWNLPLAKLAVGILTPFTSVYRPIGSLFYRSMYLMAGLNPLPFRIAAYALMLVNLWLLFRLVRALTGSVEIALLCALIGAYHTRLFGLYVNGGTIYDILCFTFFCLAFTYYVTTREKPGNVTGWRLLGFCILYSLALNSKEMAASLPLILLAYELIYHPSSIRRPARWLVDRIALWAAFAMTILAFKLKTMKGSSFYGVGDYVFTFSAHQYFETTTRLIPQVFFLPEYFFSATQVVCLFAALWAIAIALKSKPLMLAAAIIVLAPLPINFIVYRGFFVMYLPLAGWALYASTALILIKDRLATAWMPARAGVFIVTALVLFTIQFRDRAWTLDSIDANMMLIRDMRADLLNIRPSLPPAARVLFLNDAFTPDTYNPLYIVRLLYKGPDIVVDRLKIRPADSKPYTLVLDYRDRHYTSASN